MKLIVGIALLAFGSSSPCYAAQTARVTTQAAVEIHEGAGVTFFGDAALRLLINNRPMSAFLVSVSQNRGQASYPSNALLGSTEFLLNGNRGQGLTRDNEMLSVSVQYIAASGSLDNNAFSPQIPLVIAQFN